MEDSSLIIFDVAPEDDGSFSAYARVGTYSMLTQGNTLEELRISISSLIEDYNIVEPNRIESFALAFSTEGGEHAPLLEPFHAPLSAGASMNASF
ncbi:hypothetical protein IT575_10130 [bacterium]|nr:hypothetical protein [bacterium]